jgi:microcystin-dependent protein
MSNCTNCFNGCTEIVSDRCVRYTGIDIPELGIQNGDTLSSVEQSITTYLVSVLDGSGVKIDLSTINVCALVQSYLPACSACTDVSIADIAKAVIQAACSLQVQVNAIVAELVVLNANYTLPANCLTGVTSSSDTHAIVQAVINKLCSLNSEFLQLLIDLPNTYVAIANLDVLIQEYLNTTGTTNLISNRMVPYAVLPYFGPLTNFDSQGAGLDLTTTTGENWTNIYLCNGIVAPDLRGRALVGAIQGVPGGALNSVVDPGVSSANPNYSLGSTAGANQVTLSALQIPIHTHANTAVTSITPETHNHSYVKTDQADAPGNGVDIGYVGVGDDKHLGGSLTTTGNATLTAATVMTNAPAPVGGGLPHPNIQPVTGCYYIQYRP